MKIPFNLWELQAPIRALYTQCVEPVCRQYGVTRIELDILLFLANNPSHDTAAGISEARYLAKSNVSNALKALESAGYLNRTAVENDRRLVRLSLTDQAAAVVEAGRDAQSRFLDIVTEGLTMEDRGRLYSYIWTMENNIKAHLKEHGK